jgi:hypothetical protein
LRLVLLLLLAAAVPAVAQEKAVRKKPAVKPSVHAKATPEQIRRFNQLAKKQQQQQSPAKPEGK